MRKGDSRSKVGKQYNGGRRKEKRRSIGRERAREGEIGERFLKQYFSVRERLLHNAECADAATKVREKIKCSVLIWFWDAVE